MFQLTDEEAEVLRSQIATSKGGRGGRRYLPYAVTDLGVATLSTVLNSERAVQMNMLIMWDDRRDDDGVWQRGGPHPDVR